MSTQDLPSRDSHKLALQVARTYLQSAKQWSESQYRLEIQQETGDAASRVVIVDAIHEEDRRASRRGGGKSVQLHIDLIRQAVVKELAYQ
jgi:hypothetical protein